MKKRRLDELLSKKFSVTDSPPHSSESNRATPSINSDAGVHPASDHHHNIINSSPIRRDSTEIKRQNRRKRSSPTQSVNSMTSSSSPITLAVRPNSELLMAAESQKKSAELIKAAAELKAEQDQNNLEDDIHHENQHKQNGGSHSELKFQKKFIFVARKTHFLTFAKVQKNFFCCFKNGKKSIFAPKKC